MNRAIVFSKTRKCLELWGTQNEGSNKSVGIISGNPGCIPASSQHGGALTGLQYRGDGKDYTV